MIGLFGQAAAYASIAPAKPASMAMAGMSDDCMRMMAQQPKPERKPCTGMTLDCIAAMGCTVPVTLAEPFVLPAVVPIVHTMPTIAATQSLATRVVAPEPEPPSLI
jgi:hypothetical protein